MPWQRMYFKSRKQKVYAEVTEDGAPVEADGRVNIRYRLDDTRTYSAAPRNLSPIPGAELETAPAPEPGADAAGSAPQATKAKAKAKKTSKRAASSRDTPKEPASGGALVYTDGACQGNPGPCGYGVIVRQGETQREISGFLGKGTNNIAELTAILRALEALRDFTGPIELYTDSSYAIGVLQSGWKAKANQALIAAIQAEMARFASLTLRKVKGHAGEPLNERADALATGAVAARAPADPGGPLSPVQVAARTSEARRPDLGAQGTQSTNTARADAGAASAGVRVVEAPAHIPQAPPDGVLLVFTDGACRGNPGPAGLGVVMAFGEHRKEISEYLGQGTNNIAELTAILRALESISKPQMPVHLYTDSSYALGVLGRGWKAKANQSLIAQIKGEMTRFADLTLFKVKGHVGHALNERVDALANEAIDRR